MSKLSLHACPSCGYPFVGVGQCDICRHIDMAEAMAKERYPHLGSRALSEVMLMRHAKKPDNQYPEDD